MTLGQIEAALAKATPLPWAYETDHAGDGPSDDIPYAIRTYVDDHGRPVAGHVEFTDDNKMVAEICRCPEWPDMSSIQNFPLIVAAVNALPGLLRVARAAQKYLAAYDDFKSGATDDRTPMREQRMALRAALGEV